MWYIYEKRKMKYILLYVILTVHPVLPKYSDTTESYPSKEDNFENNVIDFEEDYSIKFQNKYDKAPWHSNNFKKESHRYTIIKDNVDLNKEKNNVVKTTEKPDENAVKISEIQAKVDKKPEDIVKETTPVSDFSVLPIELVSTTENKLLSIIESTTEPDLTVIPLTVKNSVPRLVIKQTVVLPSTQSWDTSTEYFTTENVNKDTTTGENNETTTTKREVTTKSSSIETTTEVKTTEKAANDTKLESKSNNASFNLTDSHVVTTISSVYRNMNTTTDKSTQIKNNVTELESTTKAVVSSTTEKESIFNKTNETIKLGNKTSNNTKVLTDDKVQLTQNADETGNKTVADAKSEVEFKRDTNETKPTENKNQTKTKETLKTNSGERRNGDEDSESDEGDFPVYTELDTEDLTVPEDYYDSKDVLPTAVPKTDAISVIFGLAGSVVESVAEKVVPKGIFDLFKRMQKQSEALEAERLRSREENGGLGQFTRGIIKSISTGLSKPLSQLMAGVKDIGSLDTDRGFVSSVASSVATGVTSVANVATSVADAFKDRVQAIYPGTLWCGDGHSATARSGDLGLFFFTDTCCRQHDACKIYIKAGETKYGLTNTGLFTRSHCSCDTQFRECLRKTNSLVSAQIGITYFNVLGPQCFRKAHPIVKCVRRTRITGQKCEEYELDYTKPKMWQWFDNETY